ncbi:MAG: Gfo/Idh/MocA family oxidoreductase [Bryobacterales bacterium]|nr:Gfo/Idh/MocA family oxidoreductase [Bryobacterales bacterium]
MPQRNQPALAATRRQFLSASTIALGAASYSRVLGANKRLRIANIGCGRRDLLKEVLELKIEAEVDVVAVCDTWRQKREAAVERVKEATGTTPFATPRLADILSRDDVDAVVIGTPDHLHCTQLIEAVRAGKDVYVEKPLAMNMEELIRAYDAVKQSGRIVQIGTQMRSYPQSMPVKEALAQGALGQVLKVEQVRNGYRPYWVGYGGDNYRENPPRREDVDWGAFLLEEKSRPFDAVKYRDWYGYREFSLGPQTNLMVHFIDLVHYVTGLEFPRYAVSLGGTFRWKMEGYDVPDSVEVAYEYPEGFLVRYATTFGNSAGNYAKWFGTRGTLDAKNLSPRNVWEITGDGSGEPDRVTAPVQFSPREVRTHMQNFFDCVRTRQQPIAPIEAGYSHSVAVLMADEAMRQARRFTYNHQQRTLLPG